MSDGYLVARCDETLYVRVRGLANMQNTPVLDAFLRIENSNGANVACIDLEECGGMDSTFMGTLVGYHHRLSNSGGRLVVVNPGPANQRLLDMLGVSAVLPVLRQQRRPKVDFIRLSSRAAITPAQRAKMMKRAHEHLVDLSEANRGKFSSFLQALDSDLKRIEERERNEAAAEADAASGAAKDAATASDQSAPEPEQGSRGPADETEDRTADGDGDDQRS